MSGIYLNSQGGLTDENFQIFLLKEAESRNEKNVFILVQMGLLSAIFVLDLNYSFPLS